MQAWLLDNYGKKQPLRLAEVAEPALAADDVLVQVRAAGVNVLDAKIRNGEFKLLLPYKLPLVLGHDVAGTVLATGARVTRFAPGDEVYARPDDLRIGTFAERIAVRESALAKKPATLSMEQAASLPLVGLTAWQALVEVAKLQAGEKVFIQAGSGGVGSIAIQLAKHLGAFVATTASAANAAWLQDLGADLVLDYKKDDIAAMLRDYDVVLHSQDTATLVKSLSVLRPGGRLVSISGPPDPAFARAIGAPWLLRLAVRLLSARVRRLARRRQVRYDFLFMRADGARLDQIAALVDAGVIRPVIDSVFPFARTPEALAYVETGHAKGKVIVGGQP